MPNLTRGLVAASLGAIIGTLLASQLATFWLIGTFIGGILAWIACDFKGFIEASSLAFSYLPNRLRVARRSALAIGSATTTLLIAFMIVATPLAYLNYGVPFSFMKDLIDISTVCAFGVIITTIGAYCASLIGLNPDEAMVKDCLGNSPFKIYCIIVPSYTLKFLKALPALSVEFHRVTIFSLKRLFWLAHNNLRLCSLVGATCGSIIGYLAGGSVIIGGLVGAMAFTSFAFATYLLPNAISETSPIQITGR